MGHKSQLNFQHFANKRIGDLGFHAWARAQVLKFDAKQYFCSLFKFKILMTYMTQKFFYQIC